MTEELKKLRAFLSRERDRQQEKLAELNSNLPARHKENYTEKETIHLQMFSATLAKITVYSDIIDILKEF